MGKIVYIDTFSGISGDMLLGALIDAGFNVERLREEITGRLVQRKVVDLVAMMILAVREAAMTQIRQVRINR